MNRPAVSVVMPFSGDRAAAEDAVRSLRLLDAGPGDQLILVDNSPAPVASAQAPVSVLVDPGEHSPAHARNTGAAAAENEWILFLDADTHPRGELLGAFFATPIGEEVGAITGEVLPAPGAGSIAARYGTTRNFLAQEAHQRHPFRPRAVAANLLVRRAAFEQLGGFYEGVRAGEDTDFSWRLQEAGWRLELCPDAAVEHRYRATVGELRRQWRGYAAGRAWLSRRYQEFHPQPAAWRALDRIRQRGAAGLRGRRTVAQRLPRRAVDLGAGPLERGQFLALDVLLGLEEVVGLALSNRPGVEGAGPRAGRDRAEVVLVAESFPAIGDPLVELASTLERVRVEALARPEALEQGAARAVPIDYLEDDGVLARWAAATSLVASHPVRAALDLLGRPPNALPLRSLAPAVLRLGRDRGARVHPLGRGQDRAIAERLTRLAGRAPEL